MLFVDVELCRLTVLVWIYHGLLPGYVAIVKYNQLKLAQYCLNTLGVQNHTIFTAI